AAAQAERERRNERTERSQAARDGGRPPEREREREAPPPPRPRPPQEARPPQEMRPQEMRPQDMRPQDMRPAPRDNRERDRERDPNRPGMAQRRDRGDRNGGDDRQRPPQNNNEGVRGFRDVVADADDLGEAAAQANRSARRTYANVPSPTPEFDRL